MSTATSRSALWKLLGCTVLALAAIALAWKALPVEAWVGGFLDGISGMGVLGPVAFGFIYVVAALLGVPRTPFNVGAGIVFSFPIALAVVLASAATSFLLTFLIARHAASDWVERKIAAVPKAKRIMRAVEEEGFKLVLLLRMNPFVPAAIKGYGFGTTSLKMSTYFMASILGFLPIGVAHVTLGWLGGAAMMSTASQPAAWRTGMLVGGVVVSLVLVAFITWFANRALNRRQLEETS